MTNRPDATRPWQRGVAIFLGGQTISLFGSSIVQYAAMWHLTITTRSGTVMLLWVLCGMLPQAIVSLFGGVWADRYNRKALIMIADGAIAASTLALALVFLTGHQPHALLYLTLAIRSIGAGVQTPAVAALLPQITPTDQLMRVNGLNGSIQNAMMLISPAVSAALYAWLGLVATFFVDVVTAVIGIGLLAIVRVPTLRSATERTGYLADLVAGVRYVGSHRVVRRVLVLFAAVFLLAVPASLLTPLLVVRDFGTGAGLATPTQEVAMLTGIEIGFSAGAVVGGAILAAWRLRLNRMVLIGTATMGLGALSAAMGFAPWYWLVVALMVAAGLCVPFFSTPSYTLLQETTEPEVQGRVFGFVGIVTAIAMPLGMAVFGPLADVISVQLLLVVAGVAVVPCGLLAFAWRRDYAAPDRAVERIAAESPAAE